MKFFWPCPFLFSENNFSSLLLSSTTGCDWVLLYSASDVYFNLQAISDRLSGFPTDTPLALARMSGRLSRFFLRVGTEAVFFGIMRTGLLLNRAAIELLNSKSSESLAEQTVNFFSLNDDPTDQVVFEPVDIAVTLFLYRTIQLRIQNWASYLDHYLLAASAATVFKKAQIRARMAQSSCVLAAYPANNHTVTLLSRQACTYTDTHNMDNVQYSWQTEPNMYASEPYYSQEVVGWLANRQYFFKNVMVPELFNLDEFSQTGNVMLSPPGGGTTWLFRTLSDERADIFHPYVNEVYRAELSYCFSAGEDETSKKLFASEIEECKAILPMLINAVTNDAKQFFTKEVMNVFRILEINDKFPNIRILLLYRSRFSTFPTVGVDTCRMCFYDAFYRSLMSTRLTLPWLVHARKFVADFDPESVEAAVFIHTTLWRYIFSRIPPKSRHLVIYDRLITTRAAEDLISLIDDNWKLNAVVDLPARVSDMLATRKPPEWLNDRHIQYANLGIESKVIIFLEQLQLIDPETDASLLFLP